MHIAPSSPWSSFSFDPTALFPSPRLPCYHFTHRPFQVESKWWPFPPIHFYAAADAFDCSFTRNFEYSFLLLQFDAMNRFQYEIAWLLSSEKNHWPTANDTDSVKMDETEAPNTHEQNGKYSIVALRSFAVIFWFLALPSHQWQREQDWRIAKSNKAATMRCIERNEWTKKHSAALVVHHRATHTRQK